MVRKEKHMYLRGNVWWVKIPLGHGQKPLYESTGISTDPKNPNKCPVAAMAHRDKLLAQKHRNELQPSDAGSILIGELLDDLLTRWRKTGKASSAYSLEKVVTAHLRPSFGSIKVARLTTAMLERYRDEREAVGRSGATINRELAYLRIALKDGAKTTPKKVGAIPHFPMTSEADNVRTGFLNRQQYETILDELNPQLKPALVIGFHVGMRLSEVLHLRWENITDDCQFIRLVNAQVKNHKGRVIPIWGDMKECFAALARDRRPDVPWVLHRNGVRITTFRGAWLQAVIRAGLPKLLFHDLRRSAVRNMRKAKIDRETILKIIGHKTENMFIRYAIIDEEDITTAAAKLEASVENPVGKAATA